MEKKKILIVTNHLMNACGVFRTLTSFANSLAEEDKYDITICFMLRYDKSVLKNLNPKIKTTRAFHIPCFRGYDRLQSYLPGKFLYKRVVKKEKYDLEIAYCWRNPTKAVSCSTNKDAKHLLYTHGHAPEAQIYYKKYDEIIAISSYSYDETVKECNGEVPVVKFSNIFEEKNILIQAKTAPIYKKTEGKTLFVTVGRVDHLKGIDRVIHSAKKLSDEGYQFECWIIGTGAEENQYKKYVEDNKLEEYVKFLGMHPNPYNYMVQADAYLCSSTGEGYSTTCVEASVLEVPVISTDVSGAKDIVEDAEAGLVVDNSEEGVYKGMKFALENKDKLSEWKKTLTKTKFKFYRENRKKELIKIIDDLLDK